MAMVKVWNDNIYPYKERFKGEEIVIPPKSYIEMDYEEAIMFRGTFSPIVRDADGQPTVQSYKMIRAIERPPGMLDGNKITCQACGIQQADQMALAKHINEKHSEQFAPESRDAAAKQIAQTISGKR